MSYRLELDKPLATTLQEVATEQIDDALSYLQMDDVKTGAHNARKICKKLRALVRLVRPGLGEKVYSRENAAFRDISRELAPLRDADAFVETLDALLCDQEDVDADKVEVLRTHLNSRRDGVQELMSQDGALDQAKAQLQAARDRVPSWSVRIGSPDDLIPGIHKTYARGYRRRKQAEEDPTTERLHEWRKSVKYLWYQSRLINEVWPDMMSVFADQLHDLSSLLGNDHDCAELYRFVREEPSVCPDKPLRKNVLNQLKHHRQHLQSQLWPMAALLYAEKPETFTSRIRIYWQARVAGG